jgi:hypothetical protein
LGRTIHFPALRPDQNVASNAALQTNFPCKLSFDSFCWEFISWPERVHPLSGGTVKQQLIKMAFLAAAFLPCSCIPARTTPMQVYGAWHCGSDFCTWASARDMTDFDTKNHWVIDRGDGSPSVNLVVLSFVNPLKLLGIRPMMRATSMARLSG